MNGRIWRCVWHIIHDTDSIHHVIYSLHWKWIILHQWAFWRFSVCSQTNVEQTLDTVCLTAVYGMHESLHSCRSLHHEVCKFSIEINNRCFEDNCCLVCVFTNSGFICISWNIWLYPTYWLYHLNFWNFAI